MHRKNTLSILTVYLQIKKQNTKGNTMTLEDTHMKNKYETSANEDNRLFPGKEGRNIFDVKRIAANARELLKDKTPISLRLLFNPVSFRGELVIETTDGCVFVPLGKDGELVQVGGCWSLLVYQRLYYAQKNLSASLRALGEELEIPVIDRCLYGAYLDGEITCLPEWTHQKDEFKLCLNKQKKFRKKYHAQIEERKGFNNWMEYHNDGFGARYIALMEVQGAIDRIYKQRSEIESLDGWKDAKTIVWQLMDIIWPERKGNDASNIKTIVKEEKK